MRSSYSECIVFTVLVHGTHHGMSKVALEGGMGLVHAERVVVIIKHLKTQLQMERSKTESSKPAYAGLVCRG